MSDQKEPLRPKNNFEMIEMLSEGFTCQVPLKFLGPVCETLEQITGKTTIETSNGMITITPISK